MKFKKNWRSQLNDPQGTIQPSRIEQTLCEKRIKIMSKTKISWTERSWNPTTGCTKISTGCKHCYAEGMANRFWGDRKFTDIICHEDRLGTPLKTRKPSMRK
jgi:DNA repair photolyase